MDMLVIAILLPIILPVLPPAKILAYQQRLHLQPPKMENGATAPLPQYYADMLDWRQKADLLAAAWYSLPQAERAQAVIYTENCGDASAVNVYRPDVPEAISGHQNYFFWGPRGETSGKPSFRHSRPSVKKADGHFTHKSLKGKGSGAPGGIRTHNILLRSRSNYFAKSCQRSG